MQRDLIRPVLATSPIEQVAHGKQKPLYFIEINLDVAGTLKKLPQPGNMIYFDQDTTGVADLYFSDPQGHAFPVGVNSAVKNFLYSELYLTWSAQAGKVLRIWYGWDADIIPPNQDISNIGVVGSITTMPALGADVAGANHYYGQSGASAVLQTIITPAANTNGFRVRFAAIGGANGQMRMMHHTSAPTVWNDTNAQTILQSYNYLNQMRDKVFDVPAGEGIYFQMAAASSWQYTLNGEFL